MPAPKQSLPGRALLRKSAYVALRDAIATNELGAWLNVSRTPIQEALARLERTGLVQTKPRMFDRGRPARLARHPGGADGGLRDARARRLRGGPRLAAVECEQLRRANAAFASALDANDADATRANWQTVLDAAKETHVYAG